MKQAILPLVLALAGTAFAQGPADWLARVCVVRDLAWVCEARALAESVEAISDDILGDFQAFAESNFERFLRDGLEYVAAQLDTRDVARFVDEISAAIREGPRELRTVLRERLDDARQAAFAERPGDYPEQSPDWWSEVARRANPNLTAAEAVATDQRLTLLERSLEAEAAYAKAAELAETAAAFDAVTEKVNRVLGTPVVGAIAGLGDGEAQQLRDDARTAVSTRAAVRYLTEGVATLMEQEATYHQDIASKLTIQIQQQALTNHQLNVLARTLTEERMGEIAQAKAELQAEIEGDFERGAQLATTLRTTEAWVGTLFARDVRAVLDVPGMY